MIFFFSNNAPYEVPNVVLDQTPNAPNITKSKFKIQDFHKTLRQGKKKGMSWHYNNNLQSTDLKII
jgi:hypothetical protein